MWTFQIIDNRDEIWSDSNLKHWNETIDKSDHAHVFFHPTLVKAWLDTYKPLRSFSPIFIWATDSERRIEGFIPMVIWKRNWKNAFIKSIVPVGYSDYDYHNPIFNSDLTQTQINSFWNELKSHLNANYSCDELIIDGITDRFIDSESTWRQGEICPELTLEGINNDDELMRFFKTSLRGDIRRQLRRLSEQGEVGFKEFSDWDEISKSNTFNDFMTEHKARWPKAYKAPRFHENMLKEGLKSGTVHFSAMTVGGKEIAWHLGFEFKGRYYYYMPAGHRDFYNFSPAKLHLYMLVRRAVEKNLEVFDHLRGEENYKSGWSNGSHYVNSIVITSNSLDSKLKRSLLNLRKLIKK